MTHPMSTALWEAVIIVPLVSDGRYHAGVRHIGTSTTICTTDGYTQSEATMRAEYVMLAMDARYDHLPAWTL